MMMLFAPLSAAAAVSLWSAVVGLTQTSDIDKDERFMATSDLCHELSLLDDVSISSPPPSSSRSVVAAPVVGPTLDSALQSMLSRTIVTLLEDSSTDVQTVSVKCLALLSRRLSSEQVGHIIDKLSSLIADPAKQESRDIYSIGLKTMVQSVAATNNAGVGVAGSAPPMLSEAPAAGVVLSQRILAGMISGLQAAGQLDSAPELDVTATILDIMKEVLTKFGHQVSDLHETLLSVLTPVRVVHEQSRAQHIAATPRADLEGGEERGTTDSN